MHNETVIWTIEDGDGFGAQVQIEAHQPRVPSVEDNLPAHGRFTRLPQRLVDTARRVLSSKKETSINIELQRAQSLLIDSVNHIGATVPFQPQHEGNHDANPYVIGQEKTRRTGKKRGSRYTAYTLNEEGSHIVDTLAQAVSISEVKTQGDYDRVVTQLRSISHDLIAQLSTDVGDTAYQMQKLWIKRATETVRLRGLNNLKQAQKQKESKSLARIQAEYTRNALLTSLKIELDGSEESWNAYSLALSALYQRGKNLHARECDNAQPHLVQRRKEKDTELRSLISRARNLGYREHMLKAGQSTVQPVLEPQVTTSPQQVEPTSAQRRINETAKRVRQERLRLAATGLALIAAMAAVTVIGNAVEAQEEMYTDDVELVGASLAPEVLASIAMTPSVEPSVTPTATVEPTVTPVLSRRYFTDEETHNAIERVPAVEIGEDAPVYREVPKVGGEQKPATVEKGSQSGIDYSTPGEVIIDIEGLGPLTRMGSDGKEHGAQYIVSDDVNLPKSLQSGQSLYIKTREDVPIHIHHSLVGKVAEIAHKLLELVRFDEDKDGEFDNEPKRLVGRNVDISKGGVHEKYIIAAAEIIDARQKDAQGNFMHSTITTADMLNTPSIKALIDAGYGVEVHNTCYRFDFYLNSEGVKVWFTDKYLIMAFVKAYIAPPQNRVRPPIQRVEEGNSPSKQSSATKWFRLGRETTPWAREMARKAQARARS